MHSFFQGFTVLTNWTAPVSILSGMDGVILDVFTFLFILFSYASINLGNIYFASAVWESLFPKHRSNKEYVIIGLIGTGGYLAIQLFSSYKQLDFPEIVLETIIASFIASLGITLLINFLSKTAVRHRESRQDKMRGTLCWLVGVVASIWSEVAQPSDPSAALLAGMVASSLAFLLTLFIEETLWSMKRV